MKLTYYIVPFFLLVFLPIIPALSVIKIGFETCNNLFATVGVLFSVAMSLIIAFNTRDITDQSIKKRLRLKMSNIRNVLIAYFFIAIGGLLFLKHSPELIDFSILRTHVSLEINYPLGYVFFLVWCLIVIVANYIRIHDNYEQLEDTK